MNDSNYPVTLQRCVLFVGRTTNWLYEHLRFVPRYGRIILCDMLVNREEFSELEASTAICWFQNETQSLLQTAYGTM